MRIEVKTFVSDCTDKEQAVKVLEEAAEVFGAWQTLQENMVVDGYTDDNELGVHVSKIDLADEIADVIQAACNLAARYGLDITAAMERCESRNRERGRYAD